MDGCSVDNPTGRLVAPNVTGDYQGAIALRTPPDCRLAYSPIANTVTGIREEPTVRLAWPGGGGAGYPVNRPEFTSEREAKAALLVSFAYLNPFLKNQSSYYYRDWVLDSGAFSAYNSGVEIKLQDYIDTCKRLLDEDSTLTEVFALDVIGDWEASLRNAEEMGRQGVPAIPCYHLGEPEHVLLSIARDYPKIALGGCVRNARKLEFAEQCFARVWPKKIHGFGFGSEKAIMALPFHSTDASNWEITPCRFGRWKSYGGRLSVRGSRQNLLREIEWYLDLEYRARIRWKKEMVLLDGL